MSRLATRNLPALAAAVLISLGSSGCLFFGHKPPTPLAGAKAAPDKVLFERATDDIQHGRYTVARLTLQTLINTYPDSEYLGKAKLAIADSFYKEGGTEGLTQAVAEYKDFITFFPFLDQAAYAQYQVAMSHFRMMEKPDRDNTQALLAESEFQTMILKYPQSQWTAEANQRLREVQEVLADGNFRVAQFYDLRGAYGAAAARLLELTERYPLFSQADEANYMLAKIYEKTEHNDFAARFYSNIVREYPDSSLDDAARKRLLALGYPVPQPDPKAVAQLQEEKKAPRQRPGIMKGALGILKSGPDVSQAARFGEPNLTAETDVISAREVLAPSVVSSASGGSGNGLSVVSATDGGGRPIDATAPGMTGSSGAAGTQDRMSREANSMPDPLKGPKTSDKGMIPLATGSSSSAAAVPASSDTGGSAGAATPGASSAKTEQAAASDKTDSKNKKKDDSSKKKKKKGVHKLIPW